MSRLEPPAGAPGALIPAEDLAPGMVLAEEVRDQQGRLLMPAGTELTERHLRAFQLWGIRSVRVFGAGGSQGDPVPELTPAQLAEGEAIVRARFQLHDLRHPLIAELLRLAGRREAVRLAAEARGHA